MNRLDYHRLACYSALLAILMPTIGLAGDCDLKKEDDGTEAVLKQLKDDPLAKGYSTHIRLLESVVLEQEQQHQASLAYKSNYCEPFVARDKRYEQDVANFNSQCGGDITDPGVYENCVSRKSELDSRNASLDIESVTVKNEANRINNWADQLLAKAKTPLAEAKSVLDPAHLDQALWLYATNTKRTAGTDCEAMAAIVAALARKVSNGRDLVGWAGSVLARGGTLGQAYAYPSTLSEVSFGDSGFRTEYQDGGNQVRHFLSYFGIGFQTPTQRIREAIADCRDHQCNGHICENFLDGECSLPDYKLGLVAAELGNRFANDASLLTGNVRGYIRGAACQ